MRFSEREEQKLQQLAADRGMPRGADCVMAEGTLEGRGIAIRTHQGVVWIPEAWRVTMDGTPSAGSSAMPMPEATTASLRQKVRGGRGRSSFG
jgi:hypothetical protein